MSGVPLLLLAALTTRFLGALLRHSGRRLFLLHAAGWLLGLTAVWMAMGAVGCWAPLWPALALGLVAAVVDSPSRRKRWTWLLFEVPVALLLAFVSLPPLATAPALMGVATVVVLGAAAEAVAPGVAERVPPRVGLAAVAIPAAVCLLVLVLRPAVMSRGFETISELSRNGQPPHLGLMASTRPERLVLATGAVGWLAKPRRGGPCPGALLFHGQHPEASMQTAAVVLRHALLDAGFAVLSVDHIGFGESPAPAADAPLSAWDPTPTSRDALRRLRTTSGVDQVFVVGHSMGATEVLRLLHLRGEVRGGIIFGGSFFKTQTSIGDYWYRRFHSDRRLTYRLSRERVLEIVNRFENHTELVEALDWEHAPLLFAVFEHDHPSVARTRDLLFAAIPSQKQLWEIEGSTHYFGAKGGRRIVVGDTRVTRRVSRRLRLFAAEMKRRSGRQARDTPG